MKKLSISTVLLLSLTSIINAQSVGDYRSAATGNWSAIASWERFNGTSWVAAAVAPSSTDGAINIRNTHTITVNSSVTADQIVVDAGGILSLTSTLIVNDGTGTDLMVNGDMQISTGTLGASGTAVIAATGTLTLNTTGSKVVNASLTNNGAFIWNDGAISGSGAISNNGTMTINGNNQLSNTNTFTNTGTLTKQTGTGTTTMSPNSWSNSGTINLNSGVLRNIAGASGLTNTGSININNATWQNDQVFSHNAGSVISGTGSFINASTMTLNTSLTFPASLVFSNTGTVTGGSSLTINNPFTIQGSIIGAGALTINFDITWLSGTVGRPLTIGAGQTISLNTTGSKIMNASLTILQNGTLVWNDGAISGSGAISNNGTITINGNNQLSNTNAFTNTGTLTKQTGTGTTTMSPTSWSNSGTINVNSGVLRNITGASGFTNTGSININNATWQNDQVFNHNAGSLITGTGNFNNTSIFNLNSSLVIPSTLVFSSTNNITGTGDLTINSPFTIQCNIIGPGLLTLTANIIWLSGTVHRKLTIMAGQTLTLNSTVSKFINDSLIINVNGTMIWNDGPLSGTANLLNNGSIIINGDVTLSIANGFTNAGTLTKQGGTGTTTIFPLLWNNTGTININSGTLRNLSPLFNSGPVNFNGGIWQNDAAFIHNAGSVISGTGSFNNGSTLTLNISQVFPASLVFSNTGTINGAGDLTINNAFTIQGTITGTGSFTVNANITWVSGNLSRVLTIIAGQVLTLNTGAGKAMNAALTINANGVLTWNDGTVSGSGTFVNNGTMTANGDNSWTSTSTITNNGTITKQTGVGSTTITATSWSNSGTISINSGTFISSSTFTNTATGIIKGNGILSFSVTPTNNGTIAPGLSVGILTVNGSNPFGANSTLSIEVAGNGGAGQPTGHDQMQRAGNLVLGGTLTAVETGTVPDGDYIIISLTTGTVTGTFSVTNLPATYSVIYNSNNVILRKGNGSACPPSVSIAANPGNTICTGTNVVFTATPANGGTPSYQWKLNGNNVGTNNNTYSNAGLVNGDQVSVVMTSSLACANPATATSNTITMAVTATVVPSVSIAANPGNTICTGTNVVFTATPTNGGTPSYQWKLNGNNVGANSNTYQNAGLVNGDVVTVVMTSSLACASPAIATSTGITMTVTATVAPSVSISANPGNTICTGTNVTFTATPTNGGTPSYQWKLNGNNVGINSNTYSNAALVNGDVVTVVMTSSLACASPTIATSTGITMTVSATVVPSVTISANPGTTICTGTNVTFTATPTNGGTPSYQWKLNGNNVGTNSNTYSNNTLANGDIVTVVMTSSLACASPTIATSTGITMTVSATVVPSVNISANPGNTICTGTNVTFTATPTNGGTPSYQWKLNGNNVGTNSNTYSNNALANGDVVTVVMTSSLACASPTTATSNGITMTVTATVAPSVSIVANSGNTICTGTNVTFTATPTNGGTPSYQWKLNGNNVGTNSNIYSNNALANGDVVTVVITSSLACASPNIATSNAITMVVTASVTPSVTISANPGNTICAGTNVTFSATPTNGGTPSYQWKLNGNNVGTNSNTYQNAGLVNGDVVTVVMTSSLDCANPTTATSNAITMTVNPNASAGTVSGVSPLCIGQTSTYTSNGTSGGSWSSSNTSIATVNSSTGVVTALIAGTTNIIYTVTGSCSSVSASKMLTVNPNISAGVVSGVTSLSVGATALYTSTGTSGGSWSSTNNGIATVDAITGSVAAISAGTTNITYTVGSGCGSPVTAFQTLTVTNSSGIVYCGPKNTKILICHNGEEICVAPEAVPAHLDHGDIQGHCPTSKKIVTGENEQEKKLIVTAYPNPYETVFKLNIYSPISGIATIEFYTISGVKIYEMKQNVVAAKSIVTDVKSLSSFTTSIIYKVSIGKYQTKGIILRPSK
jgi:Bacterial Ig-like domain (group 2)